MYNSTIIFNKIRETLRYYHNIEISFELYNGIEVFPHYNIIEPLCNSNIKYVIKYNKGLDYILKLYNVGILNGFDIGKILYHYILFNAFLESNDYDNAQKQLSLFSIAKTEFMTKGYRLTVDTDNLEIFIQKFFIMLHEAVHCVLFKESKDKETCFHDTIEYLREISEYEASLNISNDDILNHKSFKKNINALIPDNLSSHLRVYAQKYLKDEIKLKLKDLFIDEIVDDRHFLEEATCDRLAWLYIMNAIKEDINNEENEFIQIHNYMLVALYAMGFNENIQAMIIPHLRETHIYDAHKTVIRHKSFQRLLEFRLLHRLLPYSPYSYLNERVTAIHKSFMYYAVKDEYFNILTHYTHNQFIQNQKLYMDIKANMQQVISQS